MTDAPSPRCSSGSHDLRQRAELCAKYDFDTVEMIECKWAIWDEILEALHSSDGAACGDSSQASQRLSGDLQPAPSEALGLLQDSSCFRGEVCSALPCACAETLAARLGGVAQAEIGCGAITDLIAFVSSQRQFVIDPELRDEILDRLKAIPHSPEQDSASAEMQSQSGINRSLSEGPKEGVSIPSTEGK